LRGALARYHAFDQRGLVASRERSGAIGMANFGELVEAICMLIKWSPRLR
jgi:hypothetical protein